jgi:4-amino-4-deoxy-L-arabinose transferase-like glycosyltransferase
MLFLINPLDVIGVIFALAFAYPWALILIPAERRSAVVLSVTTLALSLGGLTLWMMVLALVGALRFGVVVAGIVIAFGIGQVWLLRTQTPMTGGSRPPMIARVRTAARHNPLAVGAALIVIGMAGLIAFNTLYWPFSDDDAVSIYATQSAAIYQTGHLPTGEGLYEAYPMLLPLSHVYSYLLAGEVDEYLARIAVAALGVGTLAAAFALGRALYDTATGLGAALLLALTPAFTRWASSGYTDVPAAFFVTLTVLFAWWYERHGTARDALLLGMMAGLAAWTKNSALALIASVAVWIGYIWWREKGLATEGTEHTEKDNTKNASSRLRLIALVGIGAAITAGPWYVRNVIVFGRIVPNTVWTDQARHTAANLVPFVTDHFFLPGIVITIGIALALVEALRRTPDTRDQAALLLIGVIPFSVAWWWAASYETRFLLAVLPLFAVMGAHAVTRAAHLIQSVTRRRDALPYALQIAAVLILVVLALPAARKAVSFKSDIAHHPLMGDVQRHRVAVGPIYDAARYLNAIPAAGHILSDNYFLPFYVNRAGRVEVIAGGLNQRENLALYDYLVYSRGHRPPRFVQDSDVNLLTDIDGFRVYEVLYR